MELHEYCIALENYVVRVYATNLSVAVARALDGDWDDYLWLI